MAQPNTKVIGAAIFCTYVGLCCMWWAFRSRNNFWLMFVPPITALWIVTIYMIVRFFGLVCNCMNNYSKKTCEYLPYIFFGLIGGYIVVFSIVCLTTVTEDAQTYWSWSQTYDSVSNNTYMYLNVDNCYGPELAVTDLFGNANTDWKFMQDVKRFSFGLISQRQLVYRLGRAILATEQWNAVMHCRTVVQPNIPVEPLKLLTGPNSVGSIRVTQAYQDYSDAMFISMIILLGLQLFLWIPYWIWSDKYNTSAKMHYLLYGWPGNSDHADVTNGAGNGASNGAGNRARGNIRGTSKTVRSGTVTTAPATTQPVQVARPSTAVVPPPQQLTRGNSGLARAETSGGVVHDEKNEVEGAVNDDDSVDADIEFGIDD